MNGAALIGSAVIVVAARSSSIIISGAIATTDSTGADLVTQGGVFAVAIAIGYFMLRRGDTREKDQATQAQADLKALRDEMAILRADHLQARDALIAALTEKATMATDMARLVEEVNRLRNQKPGEPR